MAACFMLAFIGYGNNEGSMPGHHNTLVCKLCWGSMPECLTPDFAISQQPPM